jgi:desumoylating isopeptidase 1
MPQAVIDSPLGNMLMPALNQGVNANRQNGGILGIEANAQRPYGDGSTVSVSQGGRVRNVTTVRDLDKILAGPGKKLTVVFFTSATCPPCKTLYPLYDELAGEVGNKGVLVKVDISRAHEIASKYSIRATPTIITFLDGQQEKKWMGADSAALRGNVHLLIQMAYPAHLHQSLNLPTLSRENVKPVLFTKVPPLPKLLAKMGDAAKVAAVQGVAEFIESREKKGAAEAHLPDMAGFGTFLQEPFRQLPQEIMFTVVDLLRCGLADARFSGWLAEEKDHQTIVSLLTFVNGLPSCPYALRLVTLQTACNLFSSPLYPDQILAQDRLRAPITQLISSSFLDESHSNVRVAAASLLFNLALADCKWRAEGKEFVLPESDQIELAAAALEAITQEEASAEALEGMLQALGYLAYCTPLDSELSDLLRIMEAADMVTAKRKHFKDMQLITEVGVELLGKGLRKP